MNTREIKEYCVVGAGPAAICAVARLIGSGVAGNHILWIDPEFKCGDFGTVLSDGSSVPGNTKVMDYQKVNEAIYALIPTLKPSDEALAELEITKIVNSNVDGASEVACSLKVATGPMQLISNGLKNMVTPIEGRVTQIDEVAEGLKLSIKLEDKTIILMSKRVLLAIGAKPNTIELPSTVTSIDPNTVFIKSALKSYAASHAIERVAVIGSSHSAALAVMHLLQENIDCIQFINKGYVFATPVKMADGRIVTRADNTGLKGDVAKFTQDLLDGIYPTEARWTRVNVSNMADQIQACSHAVTAIGYRTANTLQLNGEPIDKCEYDQTTGKFSKVRGVYGLGIAFPQKRTSIFGEVEFAVGYGKFWTTVNDPAVLAAWKEVGGHTLNPLVTPFFSPAAAAEPMATITHTPSLNI